MTNSNFNNLDPARKQYFYNLASKGDSSAEEIFETLPEPVKDCPQEVEAFLSTRDCSRQTSGANGGDYSADNITWEDSSSNRSRGGDDMTPTEVAEVNADANTDAVFIDAQYTHDESQAIQASEEIITSASEGAGSELLEMAVDCLGPVIIGAKTAHFVHKKTKSPGLTIGVGVGTALGVAATGVAAPLLAIGFGYSVLRLGWKVISN